MAAFSAVLGCAVAALNWSEAEMIRQAAETGATLAWEEAGIGTHGSTNTVWFVGHWGFQFYAEHAGMKPIIQEGDVGQTTWFRQGDVIVAPDGDLYQGGVAVQKYHRDPDCMELLDHRVWEDPIPLRTVVYFYGGRLPLGRRSTPRSHLSHDTGRIVRPPT